MAEIAPIELQLQDLIPWPDPLRKVVPDLGKLIASLRLEGQLQNLIVTPAEKKKQGKYEVVDGNCRLAAMNALVKEKAQGFKKTMQVRCLVVPREEATFIALQSNTARTDMNPIDQFEVFRKLRDEGRAIEDIASAFNVSDRVVRQRLKLASLAPRFLDLYRAGDATMEQLMSLTLGESHAQQEAVWDSFGNYARNASSIRRALSENKVSSNDYRVEVVGIEAYKAAGGEIEEDLFTDLEEGHFYLLSPEILERLYREKMTEKEVKLKSDGWGWVRIDSKFNGYEDGTTEIRPKRVLTKEIEEEMAKLEAEQEALPQGEDGSFSDEVSERRADEIDERLHELEEAAYQYTPEQKAASGVIIGANGHLFQGRVTKQDAQAARRASAEEGSVPLEQASEQEYSQALSAYLSAHKTMALRYQLSQHQHVAIVALTHALALRFFYESNYTVQSALSLHTQMGGCSLKNEAADIEDGEAFKLALKEKDKWAKLLPKKAEDLWEWLNSNPEFVYPLLAWCAGQTVYAISRTDVTKSAQCQAAGAIAISTGLDMTQFWRPSAENYFKRVSKEKILEALEAAVPDQVAVKKEELLSGLKSNIAYQAENLIKDTKWLPSALRT